MLRDNLFFSPKDQNYFFRLWSIPLSKIFIFLTYVRNFLYDKNLLEIKNLPGFCISVGNLAVGGTGKTPVVIELAKGLQKDGFYPAILNKGYRSRLSKKSICVLVNGKLIFKKNFEELDLQADEAMLQSRNLKDVPIIVSKNYHAASFWAQEKMGSSITHWILDDGFQHRKIKRDFDLLLLDWNDLLHNSHMLPRGPFREPLSSVQRAHAIGFTRKDHGFPLSDKIEPFFAGKITEVISFEIERPVCMQTGDFLEENHRPLLALAGIARPARFFDDLRKKNIHVQKTLTVPDHVAWDKDFLQKELINFKAIITTEKDYWRNEPIFLSLGIPIFVVKLKVGFPYERFSSFF